MGFFDSVGSALASIDPGKTLGNVGTSIDKTVNQVPGGWKTVGALAASAAMPYLAPELLGETGMVDASGNIIGGGTQGAAYGTASQWTPEILAQANASSDPIGYISSLSDATPAELSAWTTPAAGSGLSAAQKAMLLRSGMNAFGGTPNSTKQIASGYGSAGNGMIAYQRQNPFLSTAQQNVVPDSTTETLTKLLRGYNG